MVDETDTDDESLPASQLNVREMIMKLPRDESPPPPPSTLMPPPPAAYRLDPLSSPPSQLGRRRRALVRAPEDFRDRRIELPQIDWQDIIAGADIVWVSVPIVIKKNL